MERRKKGWTQNFSRIHQIFWPFFWICWHNVSQFQFTSFLNTTLSANRCTLKWIIKYWPKKPIQYIQLNWAFLISRLQFGATKWMLYLTYKCQNLPKFPNSMVCIDGSPIFLWSFVSYYQDMLLDFYIPCRSKQKYYIDGRCFRIWWIVCYDS